MKVLITGSRTIHRPATVDDAMAAADLLGIVPTAIITGTLIGAEELAIKWAQAHDIPFDQYKVDASAIVTKKSWESRDRKMINDADAVILIWHWNDASDMPQIEAMARSRELPIAILKIEREDL